MKKSHLATDKVGAVVRALLLANISAPLALAHDGGAQTASHQQQTAEQRQQLNDLVKVVRDATWRFRDVRAAEAEGYSLMFGCVSSGEVGAMGLHYVKGELIGDDVLDPAHPEIVIYEPVCDGRVRLIGADFLVLKDVWDANHAGPPQLMGQLLHLF